MEINRLALISSTARQIEHHYLCYPLLFEKCFYAPMHNHFDDLEDVNGNCISISYKIESFVLDESQIGLLSGTSDYGVPKNFT